VRVPRSSRPLVILADTEDLAGTWALGALAAFLISAAGAAALAFVLYQTVQITWLDALTGLMLTVVAHEAVHALAMRAVGGQPRVLWGVRRLVPYVHVADRTRLSREQALFTMLLPLALIDLAALALLLVPATSGIALAILVANTVGSVPDLWRAGRLARLPRWVQCEHRGATVLIWAPADHEHATLRPSSARPPAAPPLVGVLGTWSLSLLVAEAVCAGGVRLLAQWHGELSVAGIRLASTEQFVSGPDVVLNFLPVVVAGAAVGTLAAAAWMIVVPVAPRTGRQPVPWRRVAYRHS
jgi:hypothetical protein